MNKIYTLFLKRFFDILFSVLALLVFGWLYVIVAILVRIKMGSPVLFKQPRPGKIDPDTGKEKVFMLYKFRTMTNLCDSRGQMLSDDERLTKFGRFLRSTSLDELPEVINILKGDMSIVGPRPLLIEYLPYYTEQEHHRHDVRPGLTGYAQVHGRNVTTWEKRFENDTYYVNNVCFWLDIKLIFLTVYKVVRRSDIRVGSEIEAGRLDDYRKSTAKKEIENVQI